MKKLFLLTGLLIYTCIFSQSYVCFENDKNKNLQINVKFTTDEKPVSVKYLGQTEEINLKFKKFKKVKNGGHPAYYYFDEYYEMINGKINGIYVFSNAGSFLNVTYKRKDKKEFYFEVIENTVDEQGNHFRKNKCF